MATAIFNANAADSAILYPTLTGGATTYAQAFAGDDAFGISSQGYDGSTNGGYPSAGANALWRFTDTSSLVVPAGFSLTINSIRGECQSTCDNGTPGLQQVQFRWDAGGINYVNFLTRPNVYDAYSGPGASAINFSSPAVTALSAGVATAADITNNFMILTGNVVQNHIIDFVRLVVDYTLTAIPVVGPLTATKTGPASAVAGTVATYSVSVTNTGSLTATGVVVTDVNANMTGITVSPLSASIGGGVTQVYTVTGTIVPTFVGTLVNTANVTGAGGLSASATVNTNVTAPVVIPPGGVNGQLVPGSTATLSPTLGSGQTIIPPINPLAPWNTVNCVDVRFRGFVSVDLVAATRVQVYANVAAVGNTNDSVPVFLTFIDGGASFTYIRSFVVTPGTALNAVGFLSTDSNGTALVSATLTLEILET